MGWVQEAVKEARGDYDCVLIHPDETDNPEQTRRWHRMYQQVIDSVFPTPSKPAPNVLPIRNEQHPELQPGEKFFSNFHRKDDEIFLSRYPNHKTLRKGKRAYDVEGNIISDYAPWFISIEEYENFWNLYFKEHP